MAKSKPKANITNIKKSAGKAVSKTYTKANYKKAAAGSQQAQTAVDKPVETTSGDASTKPRKPREVVPCHVAVLDAILDKLKPVDWRQVKSVLKTLEDRQVFHTVEEILRVVKQDNLPIVNHASAIHYFTGTHYVEVEPIRCMCFLIEAARRCAVPTSRAVFQQFAGKICKQIFINSAWRNGGVAVPDSPSRAVSTCFRQAATRFSESSSRFFTASGQSYFLSQLSGTKTFGSFPERTSAS